MGATRVESNYSAHTELGKRLTAEAARALPGKCITCGTTEGTRFLNGDVMPVCKRCLLEELEA